MAIRRIRHLGDEVLRVPGEAVAEFDDDLRALVNDMFETMYHAEGIGLAAPQIGLSLRLCVLDVQDDEASSLSHFAIFRTNTAGESQVYAVGHYEDAFVKRDGKWWFAKHRVVVHTRMLQISTHVPF